MINTNLSNISYFVNTNELTIPNQIIDHLINSDINKSKLSNVSNKYVKNNNVYKKELSIIFETSEISNDINDNDINNNLSKCSFINVGDIFKLVVLTRSIYFDDIKIFNESRDNSVVSNGSISTKSRSSLTKSIMWKISEVVYYYRAVTTPKLEPHAWTMECSDKYGIYFKLELPKYDMNVNFEIAFHENSDHFYSVHPCNTMEIIKFKVEECFQKLIPSCFVERS